MASDNETSGDEQVSRELAVLPSSRPRTARGLVLSWKQHLFHVPADAVISFPKSPYMIEDGAALGALLNTKCADKWLPVCQPEHLLQLKGKEGRACYALFDVAGQPNEVRFCRHVLGHICAKNFPKVLEGLEAHASATDKRLDVLQWRPSDCNGVQIDPKYNDWEVCQEEGLKSCKVDPMPRSYSKRPGEAPIAEGGDASSVTHGVKFVKTIEVKDGNCEVIRRPGLVTVIEFLDAVAANDSNAIVNV
jgi:hypothetical protein